MQVQVTYTYGLDILKWTLASFLGVAVELADFVVATVACPSTNSTPVEAQQKCHPFRDLQGCSLPRVLCVLYRLAVQTGVVATLANIRGLLCFRLDVSCSPSLGWCSTCLRSS